MLISGCAEPILRDPNVSPSQPLPRRELNAGSHLAGL